MQGFLLIDKPKDLTSFSVASRIRHLTGEKRVGHSGTLDPMATGVLGIFIGRATVLSSYLLDSDKEYTAKIMLGKATDTEDITGTVIKTAQVNVTNNDIKRVLEEFVGQISQIPPMYSAIKKNGVPLYKLAREGKEIKREPRNITIFSIELLSELDESNCFVISVRCSKGTYIRSLCRDIGERLGCFATLCELRRTATAGFKISQAIPLSKLTKENITDYILPCSFAVQHLKEITVTEKQAKRFSCGGELALDRLNLSGVNEKEVIRVNYNNIFLGLGEVNLESNLLKVKNVLNTI